MQKPQLLKYSLDGVRAFSTTRHGGISHGNYGEFNINTYCGDDTDCTAENRRLLCHELGIEPQHMVMPHQVHGAEIRQIGREFFSLPSDIQAMLLDGVDALTTNLDGVCIGVSTADCLPILLYDAEHHAISAVHAGWRGTLQAITKKAVDWMRASYDTHPELLHAIIGPGISLDNFEVGNEVYSQFVQAQCFDLSTAAKLYGTKWHIDLVDCNRQLLTTCGVSDVQACGICTYERVNDFFSARRLGKESGRIFTGIMLGNHASA